jgi:uncharacterized iron-regulated membrane protein
VHLWSGIIVGLYVMAISISGSILVFETNLMDERPHLAQHPRQANRSETIDYTKVVAAAQKSFNGEALASIDMRTNDRRVVALVLKTGNRQRTVYVDAVSNKVIGSYIQEQRHGILLWLEDFHNQLAGGRTGGVINGIGGAVLTLMCVTGLVIWWPGIKNWQRAILVQWKARWARINYDLHSAIGFWTVAFVTIWGATGAYFVFSQPIQAALGMFQSKPSKISPWIPGQRLLPAGTYVNTAMRAFGDADLAYLYMDVFRPHGQVTAFLSRDPAVPLTLLEDIVYMDPATGNVLQMEGTRTWSVPERIAMATYSIHFGDFGGTSTKVLWVVLGLAPALLAVSGYLMWWNRYASKKWQSLLRREQRVSAR